MSLAIILAYLLSNATHKSHMVTLRVPDSFNNPANAVTKFKCSMENVENETRLIRSIITEIVLVVSGNYNN